MVKALSSSKENVTPHLFSNNSGLNFTRNIGEKDVIRLLKYDKHTKKNADLALKDIIVPFPNFEEVDFSKGYDWQVDKSDRFGPSYQLYLQSLRIVSSLLIEFERSSKIQYLEKAQQIIESWMDFMDTEPENDMIWYDHPSANRAQNIIHFLYLAKDRLEIDEQRYYNVLVRHAEFMSNPTEYKYNNHSLMMDRSLMIVGRILGRIDLFNVGYYRAIDTFWYSFSAKGVHLENSPDYHVMVRKMYIEMEEYLKGYGYSFGKNINGYIEMSKEYLDIVSRPNGLLPPLGDSGNSRGTRQKVYRNFFDYEAGIGVLQYEKPTPVYVSFVAGFSTNTHKHYDDLSITLNYGGEDVLVDSGKFSYSRDPIRTYMLSAKAHSTLYFENENYIKEHDNRFTHLVEMTGFYDAEDYTIIKGRNRGFEQSELGRTVILLKRYPIVILLDEASTDDEVFQNFNLHQDVELIEYNIGHSVVRLPSGHLVSFSQMGQVDGLVNVESSTAKPASAVNTVGFGKTTPTHQMRFKITNLKDKIYAFQTLINMNQNLKISHFKVENERLQMIIDDEEIMITL